MSATPGPSGAAPGPRRARAARFAAAALALALAGCGSGFLGETDDTPPLPGERIAVLAPEGALAPDPEIAGLPVVLPPPVRNADWPQPGGGAAGAVPHPALAAGASEAWSVDIGAGSGSDATLLASPVVADGRVFAIDAEGRLSALDAATGRELWTRDTRAPEEEDAVFGGAVTTGGGRVFVATGAGRVLALAAADGAGLWRARAPGPLRGAPTHHDGRLFLTTLDNQAFALSAATGERLWLHSGISEVTALLGAASPAARDNTVVVPYSSGEIFALKAETGRVFWVDSLRRTRRSAAVASLADIRGHPVIDGDTVVAVSHSGRIGLLDFRTGTRLWDRPVGGAHTPWIAGDFIYVATNEAEIVCLDRERGRIRWIARLPKFEDEEDREGAIEYAGPVLAGGRLFVASSLGEVHVLSPETGATLAGAEIDGPAFLPPIVADGTMYFLTDDGRLTAWR